MKRENKTIDNGKDDYGTTEYCTCDKYNYEEHICPFRAEIDYDETTCNCCPYCEEQCADDI